MRKVRTIEGFSFTVRYPWHGTSTHDDMRSDILDYEVALQFIKDGTGYTLVRKTRDETELEKIYGELIGRAIAATG